MAINKKTILTKQGKEMLEKELDELVNTKRPKTNDELTAARALGDLSENADYSAAKTRLEEIDRRISEIRYVLNNCEIAKETKNLNAVNIGSKVTIKINGEKMTYLIVSTIESDPENAKISNESPLGKALIGHSVEDEVLVKISDTNTFKAKILNIEKNK